MIQKILPYMRCPRCLGNTLHINAETLVCPRCNSRYLITQGVLDMMGTQAGEVITPFQRLMQAPAIVSIYEKLWRRIGYYIASSRSFSAEMQTVLSLDRNKSHARIMDLACGTGVFTRPLARQGNGVVVGLDMSWPMLNHAQKLLKRDGIQNVLLVRATAYGLPFIDGTFPYVNCCGALHLFDRPELALQEIRRILAPDGFFSAQTTIRPPRSVGIAYFLERFIRFGFFDENELKEMLTAYGFDLVESERHRISYTFMARRQPNLRSPRHKEHKEMSV